ncbi:MAG: aspartate ammonia-lyase [Bacteroidetes bacterium]|nr:aspartate ammonia-lyase [Bacteroidota bacterium]
MRIEKDSIGHVELENNSLYGIHAYRSVHNFPPSGERINLHLIKAFLQVKKAAAETNFLCGLLNENKYKFIIDAVDSLLTEIQENIDNSADTIYSKIIVDPYQGGAGTSLNMNVNEVIANTALKLMGKNCGEYQYIHPLDDVNMSQSTNDTYPTALRIASLILLKELEDSFAELQNSLQNKEENFKGIIKLGRTQFQDAVPITLGQEFGAYAQAIARDRWRIYNSAERLRSVNMGGTAVGNSVSAPKEYVLQINSLLKKITGLPIAKSEDLIDATQNLDVFVEVHGIIKAGAVSIIKICNDLRFMSSGPYGGIGEVKMPPRQSGSSIMPGKVNPVILENAIQISEMIKGHDVVISNLVGAGNLELNAFAPMIAHYFLRTLDMLKKSNYNLARNCINGIEADKEKCMKNLINTSAISASFISEFGYDRIQEIVKNAYKNNVPFIQELTSSKLIKEDDLKKILAKDLGIEIE